MPDTLTPPPDDDEFDVALAILDTLETLEARGLLTIEVNDLEEIRIAPTAAGIAAVHEEEKRRGD